MSEKEPETFNLKELKESIDLIGKTVADLKKNATPAQIPQALTETTKPPAEDWRIKAVGMIRDTSPNGNFRWCPRSFAPDDIKKENEHFETIGALAAGSATPQIWAADITVLTPYPASAFVNNPAVVWHQDITGKPGGTLNIITVKQPVAGTAGCAEPVGTAPTISMAQVTMTEWQCSMSICRDDLEDIVPETITLMDESLVRCLNAGIDTYIIGAISPVCQGTVNKTSVIGTMAPGFIAEAIGSVRTGTCNPVAGLMHPVVEAQLMNDSQFVNAATFGARDVITGGHITSYLGIDFVVIPNGSLDVGAAGTLFDTYIWSKGAIQGAMKRPPSIESQYLVQTQKKYVYASTRFGASVVDKAGLWKIRTARVS